VPQRNSLASGARAALTAALVATLLACASTGSLRLAQNAESAQNYDLAVADYGRAIALRPEYAEARALRDAVQAASRGAGFA